MDEELYAERAALRCVMRAHPDWTQAELATHLGRSLSWVKKWAKRLQIKPNEVSPNSNIVVAEKTMLLSPS